MKRLTILSPLIPAFALGLCGLLLSALGLRGEPPAPPRPRPIEKPEPDRVARGSSAFQVYCASCHGRGAEGNGPMAEFLRIPPKDLTLMAREHGGSFPEDETYSAIDGRRSVRGHGPREMPVWGFGFQVPGRDSDQESEVRQRILDLLAFLKSIQK